jgi:hypothetical protein
MKSLTFEDWKAAGFYVRKGEKSARRCPKTGKPTFTRDQVEPINERRVRDDEDLR